MVADPGISKKGGPALILFRKGGNPFQRAINILKMGFAPKYEQLLGGKKLVGSKCFRLIGLVRVYCTLVSVKS